MLCVRDAPRGPAPSRSDVVVCAFGVAGLCSADGSVRADARAGARARLLCPPCQALGGRVVCRAEGCDILVSAPGTGEELRRLEGHTGAVTCVDLDDGEGTLVSGSIDGTARRAQGPVEIRGDQPGGV